MNICDVEMLNIILFLRNSFMQSSHRFKQELMIYAKATIPTCETCGMIM